MTDLWAPPDAVSSAPPLYNRIEADPPWPLHGGNNRGADAHYQTIKRNADIFQTMKMARFADGTPAWRPDPGQCHLWLWVADNFVPWGLQLLGWLGFEYKRSFVWTKPHQGMGQYAFSAHEWCLLGTIGATRTMEAPIRSDFGGPIEHVRGNGKRVHSAKPPEILAQIHRAYPVAPGHGLEMFARSERPGIDSWGKESNALPQGQMALI